MRMRARFWLVIVAAVVGSLCHSLSPLSYGILINPGFETGDLTGWTTNIPPGGSANVVTSHLGDSSTYLPVEDLYFLELKTDGPDSYTVASQSIAMASGDKLEGWAAFDFQDYSPFNDRGQVSVFLGPVEVARPWYQQGDDVPNYWDGPWEYWAWTAKNSGVYTLEFRVSNDGDAQFDSYALFDANMFVPIPEPSTVILVGAGLLGLLGLGRNKLRLLFKK